MKIGSITDHGHQKTAYCGIVNLDTDAFPAPYRERICVGNVHAGCINVDRLIRDGATYLGKGEPDLLTAHDDWAMPVSLKLGPDGYLYVLDWYDRYHCSQDAIRDPDGVDRLRGRLYRLRYGDSPRAVPLDLAAESDQQLVARLSSNNLYFRETTQRLLTERLAKVGGQATASRAANAPPNDLRAALEKLVLDDAAPRKARLHALWTLIGGDALLPPLHKKLLAHSDPTFRAWAVRAAGNQGKIAPETPRCDRRSGPRSLARRPIASRHRVAKNRRLRCAGRAGRRAGQLRARQNHTGHRLAQFTPLTGN